MKTSVRSGVIRQKTDLTHAHVMTVEPLSIQVASANNIMHPSVSLSISQTISMSLKAATAVAHSIHAEVAVSENLATGQTVLQGSPSEIARVIAQMQHHETAHITAAPPAPSLHPLNTQTEYDSPAHSTQTHDLPASYGAGISWFAQAFTTSDSQTTSSVAELYTANYDFHGSDDTFSFVTEASPSEPVVEHATSTEVILVAFNPALPQSPPSSAPVAPALLPAPAPEPLRNIAVANPETPAGVMTAPPPLIVDPFTTKGGGNTEVPVIPTITGTSGADMLVSGANVHMIQGLAGNDVLYAHSAFTSVGTQGAFTPKNVAGLQLWLDGADSTSLFADTAGTVAITNGAGVALWKDKSGNGNDVSQNLIGSRPTWISNGQNGKGSLIFDGVDDTLTRNVLNTQNANISIFVVSNPNSNSIDGATFKNGDMGSGYGIGYGNTEFNNLGNHFIFLKETITWHNSGLNYGIVCNIVSSIITSSNILNYLNGSNIQTIAGLPNSPNTITYIGGYDASIYGTRFFNGIIPETVFFNTDLPTTNRQLIELYQSAKWGIALSTTNAVADAPGIFQDDYYSVDKAAANNTLVADLREVLGGVTQTYSITSGNIGNIFTIDATTGQIKVNDATALAASNATSFALGISANLSSGGAPITLTTQIAVADSSADTLEGGVGNDTLHGSSGNNLLDGGADNDVIYGLSGNDTLIGGAGQDTMTGGVGMDRFTFTSVSDSPSATPDTITDFDANGDLIVLTGLVTGTFTFAGAHTTPFTGAGNASARFNDATNLLQIDTNGDGAADFALILKGVQLSDISITDFVL